MSKLNEIWPSLPETEKQRLAENANSKLDPFVEKYEDQTTEELLKAFEETRDQYEKFFLYMELGMRDFLESSQED